MEEVNKLGKILIVDDNEDVLFALNLLLEPYTEKIKVATTPDRIEHFNEPVLCRIARRKDRWRNGRRPHI